MSERLLEASSHQTFVHVFNVENMIDSLLDARLIRARAHETLVLMFKDPTAPRLTAPHHTPTTTITSTTVTSTLALIKL
jgi:hypothetical protein